MSASITTLPLNTLKLDPMNVRKTGRGMTDVELKASIKAKGIVLPLVVRPNGTGHMVYIGGRRLEHAAELAKEGAIPADQPVRVIIQPASDAEARELSLMENTIREDMHPVDEYRAFAAMRTDKEHPLEAEVIAAHFGLELLHVEQRLALGALDDKILDAWLADELTQEAAQAFTLCPSKKAQVAIFEQIKKKGHHMGEWAVRRELKIDNDNPGRYLAFVGAEAYEARGGKVTRDLFGSNHVISDGKLMMAMVAERTEETKQQLVAAGWAFAIEPPKDRYSYGDLQAKQSLAPKELAAQHAALEKQLDTLQKQDDYDGDVEDELNEKLNALDRQIAPHLYSEGQRAKGGCFVSIDSDGELQIEFGKVPPSNRRSVAAAEAKDSGGGKKPSAPKPSEAKVISNALADRLGDQLTEATKKALKADTAPTGLPTILKDLVAGMIGGYGMPDAVKKALPAIRDAITPKVMNEAIRKQFDGGDYFANAPIPVLLAAITEACGADEARKLKGKKKIDVAKFALANVGKTAWLPKELRTANYDAPKCAKKR